MMLNERLLARIKVLNETLWDQQANEPRIREWLSHFDDETRSSSDQLHALYFLSSFSYFNQRLLRELLRAMYRDRIRYPIVQDIRRTHEGTRDLALIEAKFRDELEGTRFLGIGNPSESGTHLLYLFRQANNLSKELFIHTHEVFDWTTSPLQLRSGIRRLVFIDDLAGSGTQATRYSKGFVKQAKELNNKLQIRYCILFATTKALEFIKSKTMFDDVDAVCELDPSFKCVSEESRYFPANLDSVTLEDARDMATRYGEQLAGKRKRLGFRNGQLLLGFAHNIPNNTLPILWHRGRQLRRWSPLFERHDKILST